MGYVSGLNAALWSEPSGQFVNLNPTSASKNNISRALATDGRQQVGWDDPTGYSHAILWSGTADSAVDLSPAGFTNTFAYGVGDDQQVGFGNPIAASTTFHALLWTGTAASAVDLNPTDLPGITYSRANATDGTQQVGFGAPTPEGPNNHALLWSGTAGSAVDLNPAGVLDSIASGICGIQEVGSAGGQAYLWYGTAASAVDLNPTDVQIGFRDFTSSGAFGTNGTHQVGYASDNEDGPYEAFVWLGTAASVIDLHPLLPETGAWMDSVADSIDASGNIYGIADGTYNGVTGNFAVEWSPVPEPGSFTLLAATTAGLLLRRKRRQSARTA